jgi:multidrug resistance efflux pump
MKLNVSIVMIIFLAFLLPACNQIPGDTVEPTPIPTVLADTRIVSEGFIVPADDVYLSFFAAGQVAEVLVEEGDLVKAGDVVARLGNREEIEAGVANAQAELLAAEQALDKLYEAVDLSRPDVDFTRATLAREISAANRAVRDSQYSLDNYTVPTKQQDLTPMEAVVIMKEELDKARDAFEPVKYRSSSDSTRERRKEDLDNAQSDYNSAVRRLELETTLSEAQARLDKAIDDIQSLEDGPEADDLAAAEARIVAAEAALHASEAALDNLDLVVTIDGTVLEQNLEVGQSVTPGQPEMRIVDFSQMYVETDDLTELEVVDIQVGQKVTIIPDALPEVTLTGEVVEIGKIFEEKRGDITYTVKILLDDFDDRLRWGMTVAVTFEE